MAGKGGLQKAKVLRENLPPLTIFPNGEIGHYVRYRVASEDRNRYSHWSPIYTVVVPPFDYMGVVNVTFTSSTITAVWGDEYNRPRYDVFVRWGNELDKIDIVSGVGTVYSKANHGFSSGDTVEIVGTGQTFLDNHTFVITPVSGHPKRFTITLPAGIGNDIITFASTAEAKTLYTYHGTSSTHTYSFLRLPYYDRLHVDIQVESIEKTYSTSLLIYDSPSITLT